MPAFSLDNGHLRNSKECTNSKDAWGDNPDGEATDHVIEGSD